MTIDNLRITVSERFQVEACPGSGALARLRKKQTLWRYLQVQLGCRAHFGPEVLITESGLGTPTAQTADFPTGHVMLQLPQAVFAFVVHCASPPGPKL